MFNRREWSDILFQIYRDFRMKVGWADIYECHDEEDRDYFMKMDELRGRA